MYIVQRNWSYGKSLFESITTAESAGIFLHFIAPPLGIELNSGTISVSIL